MPFNLRNKLKCFYLKGCLVIFLFTLGACKTQLTKEQSKQLVLNADIKSSLFRKGLEGYAEHLYQQQWPQHTFDFRLPKLVEEKLMIEWEGKTTKKTSRAFSNIKCKTNVERLALSLLVSQLGPCSVQKLMRSTHFKAFVSQLADFLVKEETGTVLLERLKMIRNSIFQTFKIDDAMAKKNELEYKTGILLTAGFYLGFPLYKRITLDKQIETRKEFLQIYLHECGHQLFDKYRKFSKTMRLGLSWIGWLESTDSWWVIEEKSCNIFAEFVMKEIAEEIQKSESFNKPLTKQSYQYLKLHSTFQERYALLFFNSEAMLNNLKNKKIENRYNTNDAISNKIRERLKEQGIKDYILSINHFCSSKEVLDFWDLQ